MHRTQNTSDTRMASHSQRALPPLNTAAAALSSKSLNKSKGARVSVSNPLPSPSSTSSPTSCSPTAVCFSSSSSPSFSATSSTSVTPWRRSHHLTAPIAPPSTNPLASPSTLSPAPSAAVHVHSFHDNNNTSNRSTNSSRRNSVHSTHRNLPPFSFAADDKKKSTATTTTHQQQQQQQQQQNTSATRRSRARTSLSIHTIDPVKKKTPFVIPGPASVTLDQRHHRLSQFSASSNHSDNKDDDKKDDCNDINKLSKQQKRLSFQFHHQQQQQQQVVKSSKNKTPELASFLSALDSRSNNNNNNSNNDNSNSNSNNNKNNNSSKRNSIISVNNNKHKMTVRDSHSPASICHNSPIAKVSLTTVDTNTKYQDQPQLSPVPSPLTSSPPPSLPSPPSPSLPPSPPSTLSLQVEHWKAPKGWGEERFNDSDLAYRYDLDDDDMDPAMYLDDDDDYLYNEDGDLDEDEDGDITKCDDDDDHIVEDQLVLLGDHDGSELHQLELEKEVEVMPWLQEAIQTVGILEARLIELEEDCQTIPLYEEDRVQMIQLIQDLDMIVQQDQTWIEQTENAVRWTSFALEEALLTSIHKHKGSSHSTPVLADTKITTATATSTVAASSHAKDLPLLTCRSSTMMPTTFMHDSDDKEALVEDILGFKENSLVLVRKRQGEGHGHVRLNDHHPVHGHHGHEQELVYRNAILTALRHLKTIELSPLIKGGAEGQDDNDDDANKDVPRKAEVPNPGLQQWLENASMMSLTSNKFQSEADGEGAAMMEVDEQRNFIDIDNDGDEDDTNSSSCHTIQPDDSGNKDERDSINSPTVPPVIGLLKESSEAIMRTNKDSMRKSTLLQAASRSAMSSLTGSASALPASTSTSARMLDHSISANSLQATLSGSSQSLQTNFDGCMLDERIFLKQHIQDLDRLRSQEKERHQRVEQIHHQLIEDLSRFSKELIVSVNDLTCAQASLDEATELALIALKALEPGMGEHADNTAETSKRKRMVATSCSGLEDSKEMVEQGIKRVRTLAADCIGITELAQKQSLPTAVNDEDENNHHHHTTTVESEAVAVMATTTTTTSMRTSTVPPRLPPLVIRTDQLKNNGPTSQGSPMPTPLTSLGQHTVSFSPTVASEQRPSPVFVDGIAFQEFEGHLSALRTNLQSISKRMSFNRMAAASRKSMSLWSTGTTPTTPTSASTGRPSAPVTLLSNIENTPFMKRILTEDIYPCLLVNPRSAVVAKQAGWMNSWLGSSNVSGGSSWSPYGAGSLTPWFQRLLGAMEKNGCEIEFWKANNHRMSVQGGAAQMMQQDQQDSNAPIVQCCLCGIKRPCEFRLRIMDQEEGHTTATSEGGGGESSPKSNENTTPAGSNSGIYSPLDRFCRDRVVAVCDFYMFLAHLRQGLLDHQSNLELFRRVLWLRQRMGGARIGSMNILQTPVMA